MQSNVRLMGVRQGSGAAIVVAAVEPGSAAAAAGVRPGQQLLAVSDPIRRGEFWQINGQSSLRYVRQAIAMRVADTIALQLTAQPIREWRRAVEASRAAQRAAASALTPQSQPAADQPQADDLLSNIVRASIDSSLGSLDSFDAGDANASSGTGTIDGDGDGPALTAAGRAAAAKLTVAEKLEQRYIEGQAAADALAAQESDLERRKRRRKEYFEQVGLCCQLCCASGKLLRFQGRVGGQAAAGNVIECCASDGLSTMCEVEAMAGSDGVGAACSPCLLQHKACAIFAPSRCCELQCRGSQGDPIGPFLLPPSQLLQQGGRNDVPFFTGVVLLIALPPAVLLFWAFSSGYIEEIDRYGLLR